MEKYQEPQMEIIDLGSVNIITESSELYEGEGNIGELEWEGL